MVTAYTDVYFDGANCTGNVVGVTFPSQGVTSGNYTVLDHGILIEELGVLAVPVFPRQSGAIAAANSSYSIEDGVCGGGGGGDGVFYESASVSFVAPLKFGPLAF